MSDDTYDALNPKGRRRSASRSRVRPEDLLMTQSRRDLLGTNALDVQRNMALLAWAIRRTTDYVCLHDFQPCTENDALNDRLRELMERDCEPERNDFVGRMSWDDHRRVGEAQQLLTGDIHFLPLREGTIQAIEGSYCRNPATIKTGERWVNGARLNRRGRVTGWNFREQPLFYTEKPEDRTIPAYRVWHHVHHTFRMNSVRGDSPVQAALNEFRDLYETFDHARAKVKLDQLFGLAFKRSANGDDDDVGNPVQDDGTDSTDTEIEDQGNVRRIDFGDGPAVFDLDEDEEVNTIEADNPGGNTIEFLKLCIHTVLLSLDLPITFFDFSNGNFSANRGAWIQYQRSCHARRLTQQRLHKRMTRWRLHRWSLPESMGGTGELILPNSMQVSDIRYRWVPRGMPWWKPAEELETALKEAAAGLRTMQGICDEHGLGNYRENLRTLKREQDEARKHGFVLQFNLQKLSAALQLAPTEAAA